MARVDFDTKKLAKKINHNAEASIRKVALDGLKKLIRQSPVDTGRFKANWGTSIGKIDDSIVEMSGTKTKFGLLWEGKKSTGSDFARSSQEIKNYKFGQTMFLQNNLQYAISLEFGTSKQAPKGWIRNTAITMQKKLNEIKDLI